MAILKTQYNGSFELTGYLNADGYISADGYLIANTMLVTPNAGLTLSNGSNDNIAITKSFNRITGPTGSFGISGFAGGIDGMQLAVFNTTSQAMTITNEATSSTANRITTLTGADIVLRIGTSCASFIYDGTTSRWIVTSTN